MAIDIRKFLNEHIGGVPIEDQEFQVEHWLKLAEQTATAKLQNSELLIQLIEMNGWKLVEQVMNYIANPKGLALTPDRLSDPSILTSYAFKSGIVYAMEQLQKHIAFLIKDREIAAKTLDELKQQKEQGENHA